MKANGWETVADSSAKTAKEFAAVADECLSETHELSEEEERLKSTLPPGSASHEPSQDTGTEVGDLATPLDWFE